MNEKQLTVRGLIIGAVGSIILTMSSMFIALKLSSLPWPIMFVVLVSMFVLKLMGNTNLQEINVTQTAMSAGAMVAGGLAFTIPGIWMLNPETELSVPVLLAVTLGGVILGLIFTALFRKYFIETKNLPYAMGQAAAATLEVGDNDKKKAGLLFISMGAAGIFTALRDWFAKIPATLLSTKMICRNMVFTDAYFHRVHNRTGSNRCMVPRCSNRRLWYSYGWSRTWFLGFRRGGKY